ncbi:DUF1062 domain-containing protein [Anaerosphaera multitolerans]|uniref:DUF1062 domain-containing protein n=1 Tax=Anaerosphaera multitolerans TaxID=2487351 RepID=A0A437S9R1_9FIRM|nr:DUF1062 domain-containing protein [Anaerosphaera multitolerans]RVU55849.1 DUF1062 domain-containing protein [Anaerosphaera multitolerans]
MKTINWEVEYLSSPKVIRYCKKCGHETEHISSDLFRINAQQKSLDIWLIYKCIHCKNTWNMTIYTRINPKSISQDLLNKFMKNDENLARACALDTELIKRNRVKIELPPYDIKGESIDFRSDTKIKIYNPYSANIKVSKVLREKLSLTRKNFDSLVLNKIFQLEKDKDINKSKIVDNITIYYYGTRIREIYFGGNENA